MSGYIRHAKCSRCRAKAIEVGDRDGWDESCPVFGLFERYDYRGKRLDRREPVGVAQYTYKDGRGAYFGWHEERFVSADELADAPARLRSLMKSGEVYPESVYLARWNEKKDRVEVLIGSRKCLHSEPPARANVSADLEMQF
jgi:hypothetical protein